MADIIKFILAAALLIAGLVGFYYFQDQPMYARVLMVLGGLALGIVVGIMSEPGRRFAQYVRESWEEAKKVVWPTRKESIQTTAAVFGFVVIMAMFLWIVDKGLEWALYDLILEWKK